MSVSKLELVPNILLAISLIGLVFCTGCKPPKAMISVHGEITAEKAPLEDGLITFVPEAGTRGQKVSVQIEQGAYAIGGEQGLNAGKYSVQVYGMSPGMKAMINGTPVPRENTNYREIATKYNSQSILSAVLKEGDNECNFTVEHQ